MTLQSLPGPYAFLGPSPTFNPANSTASLSINAAKGAIICVGRLLTSDQGSHTINTTGSSSIGWRSDAITFANAGTSVSVGIAAVDTANGQPARAVNSAGTITFDVAGVFAGGGGGITDSAYQTSVPTAGSKTIAHGDLVAIAVQMTARGGSDVMTMDLSQPNEIGMARPSVATFNGSVYSGQSAYVPNFFVTFADGAFGWIQGSDIASTINSRSWNSGSATKEYGQLFQMPFPMKICGIYGWGAGLNNDFTLNLYSDPLGTPVAQKSAAVIAKTLSSNNGFFLEEFSSPYATTADQPIGAVFTPGASNMQAFYKTIGNANNRASDPWGLSGNGISRSSGAFASTNSNLDHYYIGLLVSAFDGGGAAGGGLLVNPGMRGGMQ